MQAGISSEAAVEHRRPLAAFVARDPNVERFLSSAGSGPMSGTGAACQPRVRVL